MKKVGRILAIASVVVLGCMVSTSWAGQKITAAGSSTIKPIVQKAAKSFKKAHPDVNFAIGGGGSSHGVKSVASGEVMIGMASRYLKAKEQKKWDDLVPVKIGMDGIAVIVNAKNPVSAITKEQVQDIYTGKISNWKEVGGPDAPIMLISKEEGRSTLDLFLKYFGLEAEEVANNGSHVMVHRQKGAKEYSDVKAKLIGPNREALAAIATKPNAIAYVSIGTAQKVASKGARVRLLELDGVVASTDNVANETYPLRRPLNVVTRGEANGMVKEFIQHLNSEEGQKIVESLEFIPVK
jgi:phosphate transport system substrate-binding protein